MRVDGNQLIDNHIARTRVERYHAMRLATRRNCSYICDPANIQGNTTELRIGIQDQIDKGYERRPLTARGHISRPKIRHHRHAKLLGQNRSVTELKSAPQFVINRLTVASHKFNRAERRSALPHRLRIQISQRKIQTRNRGRVRICIRDG